MNPDLCALQKSFATAITADGDWTGVLKLRDGGAPPLIHLYRQAYRIRLVEALRENYPILHRVLGDEEFERIAHAFIHAHPSRRPSIRWFGDQLAEFFVARPDLLPHPALADLVCMEWALSLAFDGADSPALQVEDLASLPQDAWPKLRFRVHPTLTLRPMSWAVEPLWSLISSDPEAEAQAPEPLNHHLIVWRRDETTQWRSASADEAELLEACRQGRPFADLCALAAEKAGDQAAVTVAGYLRAWVESGMLMTME